MFAGVERKSLSIVLAGLLWLWAGACPAQSGQAGDSLQIVFWNLENFFDTDPGNGGAEFSPGSVRHWTPRRFGAKCQGIAKTLLWACGPAGRLPDVVAVAEVENRGVLQRLLRRTVLDKAGYVPVHFDSADPRGIDVGLLYRRDALTLCGATALRVDSLRTRDILLCDFGTFVLLVCHLPSKLGGAQASRPRRRLALRRLEAACDSLHVAGREVFLVGDFNDTPDAPILEDLSHGMVNLSAELFRQGRGSLRYRGKWELIDQAWASPSRADAARMDILSPPFLLEEDRVFAGEKPRRTYVGPRYHGGLSDHLPIVLKIAKK